MISPIFNGKHATNVTAPFTFQSTLVTALFGTHTIVSACVYIHTYIYGIVVESNLIESKHTVLVGSDSMELRHSPLSDTVQNRTGHLPFVVRENACL